MICPRCNRLMKWLITHWDECEEFQEVSDETVFCPNCGLILSLVKGVKL